MPTALTIKACWLSTKVCDQLTEWASAWCPAEVGGILAGYVNKDVAVVTEVVGPGPLAAHGATTFCPDHAFHVAEMERIHMESGGTYGYLGDWHTHPSGPETLSALDKGTLRRIGRDPDAQCPNPVMLVLSGGTPAWGLHAFSLDKPRRFWARRIVNVAVRLHAHQER